MEKNYTTITAPKSKRGRKPTARGNLERHVAKELGDFAQELAGEFDLSPETARAKSKGVKWFQPHSLTGKDGLAKFGGAKLSGQSSIDRYISYRVGKVKLTLSGWVPRLGGVTTVRYQVFGPASDFDNPLPWAELRPNVDAPNDIIFGQEFQNFDSAKVKMRQIISRHADTRPSSST